jgi:hypothetical protein
MPKWSGSEHLLKGANGAAEEVRPVRKRPAAKRK